MRMPAFKSNSVPTRAANHDGSRLCFPVWLMVTWLALVTIAIYWPAMGHGFVYDDEEYVINNTHVTSGLTLENIRGHGGVTTLLTGIPSLGYPT